MREQRDARVYRPRRRAAQRAVLTHLPSERRWIFHNFKCVRQSVDLSLSQLVYGERRLVADHLTASGAPMIYRWLVRGTRTVVLRAEEATDPADTSVWGEEIEVIPREFLIAPSS